MQNSVLFARARKQQLVNQRKKERNWVEPVWKERISMEGGNAESELPIEPGVTDPATEQKKPYIGSLACMSTTARVLAFGVVSGLIWSLALILLFGGSGSAGEATVVLASGILSGVLVSVALQRPLAKFGRLGAFVAGLLSLPLGAFIFGFFGELMEMVAGVSTQGTQSHNPFGSGLFYAAASVLAFYFFPPAILTTFLLRAVVLSRKRHEDAG